MAERGRPAARVVLSEEERETLERWARRPNSAQALALRCRIVLAAAEGETNSAIAARLSCNPSTVGKWRTRFAERRLDGLHDEPRPGKPRTISDRDVERVIVKTLEERPRDATHWGSARISVYLTGSSDGVGTIAA
jgi:transposase